MRLVWYQVIVWRPAAMQMVSIIMAVAAMVRHIIHIIMSYGMVMNFFASVR